MSNIIIYTSGTTGQQKLVEHSEKTILDASERLNSYLKLDKTDTILNIFPTFTIANWVFCIGLQKVSGAKMICPDFKLKKFWNIVDDVQPSFIPIAIRTIKTLLKLPHSKLKWNPQILTGSANVTMQDIDELHKVGFSTVWNVYGSTEFPPPILVAKNSDTFDLSSMKFNDENELLIDDKETGDIFDLNTGKFLKRKNEEIGKTWKNNV